MDLAHVDNINVATLICVDIGSGHVDNVDINVDIQNVCEKSVKKSICRLVREATETFVRGLQSKNV